MTINPTNETLITDLELKVRTANCFRIINLQVNGQDAPPAKVKDFRHFTDEELRKFPHFGAKVLAEWKEILWRVDNPEVIYAEKPEPFPIPRKTTKEDKFHPVVKLLLSRMRSRPDEFSCISDDYYHGQRGPEARWNTFIYQLQAYMTRTERAALNNGVREIRMMKIQHDVMQELLR
jgi:hypothetical protein